MEVKEEAEIPFTFFYLLFTFVFAKKWTEETKEQKSLAVHSERVEIEKTPESCSVN